jgi:hypothetical protein
MFLTITINLIITFYTNILAIEISKNEILKHNFYNLINSYLKLLKNY